ncbi:MAG: hypothetical protein Ct9H300mP11_23710 [Chloroflexota bacterium]|nr:MAG: hypothetical protein Ct9H300mP11_23710 [Chloroflexota bacterium]
MHRYKPLTINKGMMDPWLKLFDKEIRPVQRALGFLSWLPMSALTDRFCLGRTFKTAEEIPVKRRHFLLRTGARPWEQAHCPNFAKMDVRLVEEVLETAK